MAVDYAALKKGGWMRQKQKGKFALRVHVVGGTLTSEQLDAIFDPWSFLGRINVVFERLEELSFA